MELFDALMGGFATAATPIDLLWALFDCARGTAVGVLPGIGPAVVVAMLLPITTRMEVTAPMIFFAGIYYGSMYGGSTTSILPNTPGETASMVTAMEGNRMAKNGRAVGRGTGHLGHRLVCGRHVGHGGGDAVCPARGRICRAPRTA